MAQPTMNESEMRKLLSAAVTSCSKAELDDAAEEARAVDALNLLARAVITSDLLLKTEAGKTLKKLSKHINAAIKAAATAAMDAWKECVRQEQSRKAGTKKESSGSMAQNAESVSASEANVEERPDLSRLTSLGSIGSMEHMGSVPAVKLKGRPKRSGDPMRDKIRDLLAEALAAACSDEVPAECDPCVVAVEVEDAMFRQNGGMNQKYKAKYRTLAFNLKDPKNPDLRCKVLQGQISSDILVNLSAEELASNDRRQNNDTIRDSLKKECERGQQNMASTDMFKCGKCKQRKTTYYQLQTRSADEPMTTFVTCVNCGNRWKFC